MGITNALRVCDPLLIIIRKEKVINFYSFFQKALAKRKKTCYNVT